MICAILGSYTASNGNFLPTFQNDLSVQSARVKNPGCPDMSVGNYPTNCIITQKSADLIYVAAEA